MIEPSELRLGNFINNNNKVIEITLAQNVTVTANTFSGMLSLRKQDIIPIPLTEDWFIKFGFENKSIYFVKDGEYRFTLAENKVYVQVGPDELGCFIRTIQYVHELQNLYFALTGTELK